MIVFAKKIPGFTSLEQDSQIKLIKGGCFEVNKKNVFINYQLTQNFYKYPFSNPAQCPTDIDKTKPKS